MNDGGYIMYYHLGSRPEISDGGIRKYYGRRVLHALAFPK
jgi:hypothetical protein